MVGTEERIPIPLMDYILNVVSNKSLKLIAFILPQYYVVIAQLFDLEDLSLHYHLWTVDASFLY